MSDHITEWLDAYLDGELKEKQRQRVEEHIAECATCKAELDTLQGLLALLQQVPVPDLPSPERFAAQVNLLLPQKRSARPRSQLFEIGWWLLPVGLMLAWVFISTATLLGNVVAAADQF